MKQQVSSVPIRLVESKTKGGWVLDCPKEWGEWHEKASVTDICRAWLQKCNGGLDVYDAFDLPLRESFSKTTADHLKVGQVVLAEPKPWRDYRDESDYEGWDGLQIDINEFMNDSPAPQSTSLHVGKVSIKGASPEVKAAKASATVTPVQVAIKYCALLSSTGSDTGPFLRQVENWWKLDVHCLDFCNLDPTERMSVPRLIAGFKKRASPLYGYDNYSGTLAVHKTGFTKDAFLDTDSRPDLKYAVADFGRFNSALKYAMVSNLALPGRSRDAILNATRSLNFKINPAYAHVYGDNDFELSIPDNSLCVTESDPVIQEAITQLSSPDFLEDVYADYRELAYLGEDVVTAPRKPKYFYDSADRKPMSALTLTDDLEIDHSVKFTEPLRVYRSATQVLIDSLYTRHFSEPGVAVHVACCEKIMSNSLTHLPLNPKIVSDLTKSLSNLISFAAVNSVHSNLKDMKLNLAKVYSSAPTGIGARSSDQMKISHTSLHLAYNSVVSKMFEYKADLATAYQGPTVFHASNLAKTDKLDKGLRAFADYYANKATLIAGQKFSSLSPKQKSKVITCQFLSKFYSGAVVDIHSAEIVYPDLRRLVLERAKKYAGARGEEFDPPPDDMPVEDYADILDGVLDPEVSWRGLVELAMKYAKLAVEDLYNDKPPKIKTKHFPPYRAAPEASAPKAVTSVDLKDLMGILAGQAVIKEASRSDLKPIELALEYLRAETPETEEFFAFCSERYQCMFESYADFPDNLPDLSIDEAKDLASDYAVHLAKASSTKVTSPFVDTDVN